MFIYLLEWSGFPGMLQKKSCMFHICAYKIPSVKHMFHKFSHMFHTFFLIWKHMEHPWKTHEHMSGIYKNMFSLHRPYIGLIYGGDFQFRILKWPLIIEFSHKHQPTKRTLKGAPSCRLQSPFIKVLSTAQKTRLLHATHFDPNIVNLYHLA
jgi:hypothetical protein